MADVSSRLRAARERKGLQLEDISASTKIKVAQLQAIESGDFDRLPGEFFARAFVKNYAREVGLPADEIVREYDESRGIERHTPETTAEPAARPRTPHAPPAISPIALEEDDSSGRLLRFPSPRGILPVLVLATVLLMLISIMNRRDGSGEAGAVAATGAAEAGTSAAATSGQSEAPPEMLSMEINPSATIWINAKADGELAVYRMVQPGERLKLEARNDLTFRIGNAAAFQYTINGTPGRVLGGPDEVREFQITRENFRTYRR
jgi:transcriptional regulator with XRE-family HTH domain